MRKLLIGLFALILIGMLAITTLASRQQGIFEAGEQLWPYRWFQATLLDAYFGFITIYVWVAYRETTIVARVLWFILIMTLGNIAISIYVLIQLVRFPRQDLAENLFSRRSPDRARQLRDHHEPNRPG